jgi:thiol-disulfide isomerase/thioredoxin
MPKKVIWIVLSIIIAIGAGFTYLMLNQDDDSDKRTTSSATGDLGAKEQTDTSNSDASTDADAGTKGSYIDYREDSIANTSGTKLLFFHAPWCPQCRDLESDIKTSGVPSGVTIIKVDYDTHTALRQKYGVTLQTTIVRVDDEGKLVKKYVAYEDPSLEAVVKNTL